MFGKAREDAATVVELLAEHVRRDIAFGTLPPDSKLKIEDLRARYGGSAHSLREALTLLSVEGLVEASAQKGFRVASATAGDLEDITRLRAELETMGLRWSIEKGDVDWEGRVMAAHHALARADEQMGDAPMEFALEWDEANRAFHAALISACGSPRLIEMQGRLFIESRRFRLAAVRDGRVDFKAGGKQLKQIMELAINRKADWACEVLGDHINQIVNH